MDKIVSENFLPIFNYMIRQSNIYIHCLSREIFDFLISQGANENQLFILANGANSEKFNFIETPTTCNKAVYLGKIEPRKRQYIYKSIENIDFVGDLFDNNFEADRDNFLGKWSKDIVYARLTEYNSLVLLSDGELCPLVCIEALIAGLGLVISRHCTANLDLNKPFITIIQDDKLNDIEYVKEQIYKNIEISKYMRKEIREYGIKMFSWDNIFKKYVEILNNIKDT
jgi:glycosyltransferase involved in cell wall biosynthesis